MTSDTRALRPKALGLRDLAHQPCPCASYVRKSASDGLTGVQLTIATLRARGGTWFGRLVRVSLQRMVPSADRLKRAAFLFSHAKAWSRR
jgi:hypothetical protein